MKNTYAVIMAGGGGTRLWPISRKKHPKHLLPLLGEDSLFCSTWKRLEGLVPAKRILVVTNAEQAAQLKAQAPQLPAENFLIEPEPRGTAAVVGLAAVAVMKRDPEAVMMVLPSDHFIRNQDLFHLVMRAAVKAARRGYLVTLGIKPTFSSTGYGYIQQGKSLEEKYDYPAYHVLRFKEKPDETKARQMLAGGDHSWNSGMFIWRVDRILAEMRRLMPDLAGALERIGAGWGTAEQETVLGREWMKVETNTIDYGVMERAENVAVLPAGGLEWSDVGAWDALFDVLLADESGNVVLNSDTLLLETHDSLIHCPDGKLVVTIGVDDLIVVDSGDALLVCRRDQAQQVKKAIEQMKKTERNRYL